MGSEGVGKSGICFTESTEGMFTAPRHRSQVTARDLRWINGREWDILQWCYLVKSCSKATHKSNGQSDLDKLMAEMLLPV